jgi:magnesium transporter
MPSLFVGLIMGFTLSFATSRFEQVLAQDIQVAFFIPFIVYISSAVGTQTQEIYTRDLGDGMARFTTYLWKESALGVLMGFLLGSLSFVIVSLWFASTPLSATVGLSVFSAVTIAPIMAIVITEIFQLEHQDPAIGAGPITTVIQDAASIVIYGAIASAIML